MGKYFGLRGAALQYAITIIAGCDFLLFGYDQGVTGGLLTLPSFNARFPRINTENPPPGVDSSTTATRQGITVASYNLGCFIGAIMAIFLGNRLGRRKMIFAGSAVMIVGATLQCSSFQLPQFIIGRIITGIGNGINTSTVPAWQAETSKSNKRGQMVMIEGAMISGGICLSYWIDFGFSYLDPSEVSWRFPIGFQILFALIIFLCVMPLPESPRYLVLCGKVDEARDVLCALNDLPHDDPYIKLELEAIKETVAVMSTGGFRDLFTRNKDRHLHRTVLAYINQAAQQLNGINLITYYAATIYVRIGLGDFLSRLLAALNGTEYFLASFIPIFLVERVGRRPLMLVGSAGMCISMCFLAGFTSRPDNSGLGVGAAVFLFVFNTFFAIGWLGMSWLYPAEITPLQIRAPANALATSANWIFNFMVVMITPPAFENIQYKTYIIFAVINAFIFPCIYFFYPETANRSLEEMDAIFRKTNSVFSLVSIAEKHPRSHDKDGNLIGPESPIDSDEEAVRSSGEVTRVNSRAEPSDEKSREKAKA